MCPLIYFLFETSNLLYRPGNKVERSENKFGFSLKTLLCKLVFDHLYTYIINTEILDGQFLNWTTIRSHFSTKRKLFYILILLFLNQSK